MKTGQWMAMIGLAVSGLVAGSSLAETLVFQQGTDNALVTDYQGCQDNLSYVMNSPTSTGRADENAGVYGTLCAGNIGWLSGSARYQSLTRTLMRWDLSAMAGLYSDINSVTLTLGSGGAKNAGTVYVYVIKPANADWAEGTTVAEAEEGSSCWLQKALNVADWAGDPGCGPVGDTGTPNDDYDHVGLGSYDWDGTEIAGDEVQIALTGHAGVSLKDLLDQWSGDQGANAGIILKANEAAELSGPAGADVANLTWRSSERGDVAERPKLTIDYVAAGSGIGDANGDGLVEDGDLSLLLSSWGQNVGWANGNLSGDNTVDDSDLSLLLANWNPGGGAVPEPALLSLLMAGSVLALKRK